ncbi:MAG: hypothetical protein ACRD82_15825 [Blastocatellia bacterium]
MAIAGQHRQACTYLKRLYYDTVTFSSYTLNLARDLVGADHLVFGSDYPHLLAFD